MFAKIRINQLKNAQRTANTPRFKHYGARLKTTDVALYKTPFGGPANEAVSAMELDRNKLKGADLVGIGGFPLVMSLLKVKEEEGSTMGQVTIFCEPYWVEQIHEDFHSLPWGQSSHYLPEELYNIKTKLYPDYANNQLLTFGMISSIYKEYRQSLKDQGINIISEAVSHFIKDHENDLWVETNNGNKFLITVSSSNDEGNLHVISTARSPITSVNDENTHFVANNFGLAYCQSKKEMQDEPMVVVGSGLNASWASRDFADERDIIHLIPPNDRTRSDLTNIKVAINWDTLRVEKNEDGTVTLSGINIKNDREVTLRVKETQIFSAMGYETCTKHLAGLNDENVTILDTSPSKEALTKFYDFRDNSKIVTNDMRGTQYPDGNLGINTLKIADAVGVFSPGTRNAIAHTAAWKKAVENIAVQNGITMNPAFYQEIDTRRKVITSNFIPADNQVWKVIELAYKKHEPATKNGIAVEWEDFKSLVKPTVNNIFEHDIVEELKQKMDSSQMDKSQLSME